MHRRRRSRPTYSSPSKHRTRREKRAKHLKEEKLKQTHAIVQQRVEQHSSEHCHNDTVAKLMQQLQEHPLYLPGSSVQQEVTPSHSELLYYSPLKVVDGHESVHLFLNC